LGCNRHRLRIVPGGVGDHTAASVRRREEQNEVRRAANLEGASLLQVSHLTNTRTPAARLKLPEVNTGVRWTMEAIRSLLSDIAGSMTLYTHHEIAGQGG
jgi:hypothetical protein